MVDLVNIASMSRGRGLLGAFALCLGVTGCGGFDPHFELESVRDGDVDQVVYDEMIRQRIVGLGLSVVVDGKPVYARGYGREDWEQKTPVDPAKTLFRWASVSKTVTGSLGALLASRGELDLDAEVRATYPRYEKPKVTLRQLLGHTSGAMHYDNGSVDPEPSNSQVNDPSINTGIEWALDEWIDEPLLFPPGDRFSYSTFGFNLAGVTIEKAIPDARSFWELVRDEIANPFGMTAFQPDYGWEAIPRRSKGYVRPDPESEVVYEDDDDDVSWKLPGGGFMSTTEDMARYCAGLFDPARFPQGARDLAWTRGHTNDGAETGYGLGFRVGNKRVSHSGRQQKAESLVWIYPEERMCFAALSNTCDEDSEDDGVVLDRILDAVEGIVRTRLAAGSAPIIE
ncbi:Beta-lactamase [Minicystis rosea]|nr:Beta-lactamase [Minicystis rosea]